MQLQMSTAWWREQLEESRCMKREWHQDELINRWEENSSDWEFAIYCDKCDITWAGTDDEDSDDDYERRCTACCVMEIEETADANLTGHAMQQTAIYRWREYRYRYEPV